MRSFTYILASAQANGNIKLTDSLTRRFRASKWFPMLLDSLISLLILANQSHLPNFLISFIWMWTSMMSKRQRVCSSHFTMIDRYTTEYANEFANIENYVKKPLPTTVHLFLVSKLAVFFLVAVFFASFFFWMHSTDGSEPELPKLMCQLLRISLSHWTTFGALTIGFEI